MIIDISPPLDPSIVVWPGDTPYTQTLSEVRTTLHVGAHADAPCHSVDGGADIATRNLDHYLGECIVLHVRDAHDRRVMPSNINGRPLARRVLFRTDTFHDWRAWNHDFASLSPQLVDYLHDHGVITVGIDTPSVDPFDDQSTEAHHALARHDMASLEGLVLAGVEEGRYELIALPLRLTGADGSPVRAVLRTLV